MRKTILSNVILASSNIKRTGMRIKVQAHTQSQVALRVAGTILSPERGTYLNTLDYENETN